jgi:hypothetical protein
MGSDMLVREVYLPAGTTLDLPAVKIAASELCRTATIDDLRILLEEDWISDDSLTDLDDWTAQATTGRAEKLRGSAENRLHELLDEFAASLQARDVARFRFDNGTDSGAGGGVDAYVTGGLSSGDGPTDAYDAWDIVFDTDRFPDGWCERIGVACRLLHPWGDGPAAAVVTFHVWAASALGEADNP